MTNLTNMHLYNRNGQIHKYANVNEIIDEFYNVRMCLYARRKEYILDIESLMIESLFEFMILIIDLSAPPNLG